MGRREMPTDSPLLCAEDLQVMLHPLLHDPVPALGTTRALTVALVDGRVLWPLQSPVDVTHRVFRVPDSLRLLNCQLPALTL